MGQNEPRLDDDRAETAAFVEAAHRRLHLARFRCTLTIDGVIWILGFAQGAPCRLDQTVGFAGHGQA
jgi:hypothetical protein